MRSNLIGRILYLLERRMLGRLQLVRILIFLAFNSDLCLSTSRQLTRTFKLATAEFAKYITNCNLIILKHTERRIRCRCNSFQQLIVYSAWRWPTTTETCKCSKYIWIEQKKTPWSESASELYRPSDRRLSAKWLPTFADKGCQVIRVTDPYGLILGFLDRSRYFSIK
jgi:hypothetical protein